MFCDIVICFVTKAVRIFGCGRKVVGYSNFGSPKPSSLVAISLNGSAHTTSMKSSFSWEYRNLFVLYNAQLNWDGSTLQNVSSLRWSVSPSTLDR